MTLAVSISVSAQIRATVRGVVRDPQGSAVAGATVYIVSDECVCSQCTTECSCCPGSQSYTTESEGSYEFSVPAGVYNVTAKVGGSTATVRVRVSEGDNVEADITVSRTFEPEVTVFTPGTVEGIITIAGQKKTPLPDVEVMLIPDDCSCASCLTTKCECCPMMFKGKTDEAGKFSVDAPKGKYTLATLYENNLLADPSTVKVKENKTTKVKVAMSVRSAAAAPAGPQR